MGDIYELIEQAKREGINFPLAEWNAQIEALPDPKEDPQPQSWPEPWGPSGNWRPMTIDDLKAHGFYSALDDDDHMLALEGLA